jgi:uncharacterized coiled-coil protein SlyX
MADNLPPVPPWLQSVGALFGAGGGAVIALELIKRFFGRADRADDDEIAYRRELRDQVERQNVRMDELNERITARDETIAELRSVVADLRAQVREMSAENSRLRDRQHNFANWLQSVPGIPDVPRWVFERVEGPTESRSLPDSSRRGERLDLEDDAT